MRTCRVEARLGGQAGTVREILISRELDARAERQFPRLSEN